VICFNQMAKRGAEGCVPLLIVGMVGSAAFASGIGSGFIDRNDIIGSLRHRFIGEQNTKSDGPSLELTVVSPAFGPLPVNTPLPTEIPRPTPTIAPTPAPSPRPEFDLGQDKKEKAKILVGRIAKSHDEIATSGLRKTRDVAVADDLLEVQRLADFADKNSGQNALLSKVRFKDGNTVSIEGLEFNLLRSDDRVYAGALIEALIGAAYDLPDNGYPFINRAKSIQSLRGKAVFGYYTNAPSLVPSETFARMAPVVENLIANNKKIPQSWFVSGVGSSYDAKENLLHLNYKNPMGAIADFLIKSDVEFWNDLQKEVESQIEKQDQNVQEMLEGSSEQIANLLSEKQKDWPRIWRTVLHKYMTEGQDFKNWSNYLLAQRRQAEKSGQPVPTLMYTLIKDRLGFESLSGGQIKTDSEVRVGDKARVWEYDPVNGRPEGVLMVISETDGKTELLEDGDMVQVVAETSPKMDHVRHRAYSRVLARRIVSSAENKVKDEKVVVQGLVASQYLVPVRS
jgi:hypothetical protein